MMGHDDEHKPDKGTGPRFKAKWVLIGFLAIAAFFLITEHQAHAIRTAPYLLLLACPLLHLFIHRGHGGHGDGERGDSGNRDDGDRKGSRTGTGRKDAKSGHGGCH